MRPKLDYESLRDMKKLLIGTTNKAKFDEYKKLLEELPFELVSLEESGIKGEPPVGKSFEESAILKAKFYFEKSGIPTLTDQGGLEIEALDGKPGDGGERWLGANLTEEEMMAEVLLRMKGKENRECRLHVVLALATDFGIMTSESSLHGEIAEAMPDKKIQGLPYNSLLFFPKYNKYFCDLDDNEKDILSQRKHAIEKIKDMIMEVAK